MKKVDLKRSWNKVSKSYQAECTGRFWGASKFTFNAMDLVGNVKGKEVIELGCGAGQCSIVLAKKGANVTGIDFSEEQINNGKLLAKKNKVKVNFVIGNLKELQKYFSKNQFDIALSVYAFQYIENLDKLLHNVNRILKKNGVLVFSLDHPVFTSGDWAKIRNREKFFVENYFKKRKKFWIWEFRNGQRAKFYLYHRPLQDFFDALKKNNFQVEQIAEPEPLKAAKPAIESYKTHTH